MSLMFSGIKHDKSIATGEVCLPTSPHIQVGWTQHCHPWAEYAKQLISEILNYTRNTMTSCLCPNQKITLPIKDNLSLFLHQYSNRVAKAEW